MRGEGHEAMAYLEEIAADAGFRLVKQKRKDEHIEKYDSIQICESGKFNIPFSIDEQEDSNTLIVGSNKTGKTRLACNIASILQNLNWKIIVFDNSGTWKKILDFPIFVEVTKNRDAESKGCYVPVPNLSTIFDLSLLLPRTQKDFVDSALRTLWDSQVRNSAKHTLVILEELQLYAKNLRGDVSQNILRIASAGRNHRIRILGITCDLALIDPAIIRLCGQRYYAKIFPEENSKRKFRAYHGLDWLRVVSELELGYFVYMCRDKLKVVRIPCFEAKKKPRVLEVRKVTV